MAHSGAHLFESGSPLPITIPFCESRSTRISTPDPRPLPLGHPAGDAVGELVLHPMEEFLAHQIGHPESLGHVGDHPLGVVRGPSGRRSTHRGDEGVDALAGGGRQWEVLGRDGHAGLTIGLFDHGGHGGQMAEDAVSARRVDLVDHYHENGCPSSSLP